MRANTDRAAGVSLVTDHPAFAVVAEATYDADLDALDFEVDVPEFEVVCLASRLTAGLGVQLLTNRAKNEDDEPRAFITLVLNGATETFEVKPEDALDAFQHPYAFGGTLPL